MHTCCLSSSPLPCITHAVSAHSQVTFESTSTTSVRLLRPWIFLLRAVIVLRYRHLWSLAHIRRRRQATRLYSHLLSEAVYLVQDHSLHFLDILHNLKVEVERRWADRLIRSIMPDRQVAVLESLLDTDTAAWIESKHAVEQVQSVWVGISEESLKADLLHVRQIADVLLSSRAADSRKRLLVWCAEIVQDLIQLIDIVTALEERFATEKFGENAANRPYIDCIRMLVLCLPNLSVRHYVLALV